MPRAGVSDGEILARMDGRFAQRADIPRGPRRETRCWARHELELSKAIETYSLSVVEAAIRRMQDYSIQSNAVMPRAG